MLECKDRVKAPNGLNHMDVLDANDRIFKDISAVHPVERLPNEFADLPNGHCGSHQFLVDDFVKSCVSGKTPPINAWQAARYTISGIIAHESSLKNGILLEIPDFGDP